MRILVTGATGRIGGHLVKALLQRGESVTALVLPGDSRAAELERIGVRTVVGDLCDYDALSGVVTDAQAIFHLGALLPQGRENVEIFEANIRGTFNLLEAVARHSVCLERFVFASSDEVYPSVYPKYSPIDEFHPHAPYSVYGLSKDVGESMCWLYMRMAGIPVVCPRFTLTMEPREIVDPRGPIASWFFVNAKLEALRGSKDQSESTRKAIRILESLAGPEEKLLVSCDEAGPYEFGICDPRDVVQGLILMMESKTAIGQAFNLGPPCSFTYDRLVKYLSEKTGIPYVEAVLPLTPMRCQISIAKARMHLGYRPQYDVYTMIDEAMGG